MKKRILMAGMMGIISLSMALTGCGDSSEENKAEKTGVQETAISAKVNYEKAKKVISNLNCKELTQKSTDCRIILNGNAVQCDGDGAVYESGVVTINKAGSYEISGTLEDGRIEINAEKEDEVQIILNGADISCSDYAPFVVWQAKETSIYLADNTENSFTDAAVYKTATGTTEEDTPTAAIYSKDDIVFGGLGSLKVTALCNDGISGRDNLRFVSGIYGIEAADDGIVGKDSIAIWDGTFTISAGGDGMKSTKEEDEEKGFLFIRDGSYTISAENDAFQAETYLWVSDGEFIVETGGGCADIVSESLAEMEKPSGAILEQKESMQENVSTEESSGSCKGLKAGADVTVEGGVFTFDCADDAIHANETVTINGGTFETKTGDDGIHADYEVAIMDGDLTIAQCYEGIEGKVVTVSGGKIDITASDDGINAASGSSIEGSMMEQMPEMKGRQDGDMEPPEMSGDDVQRAEGEMPQEGQMPEMKGRQGGDMEPPEMSGDNDQRAEGKMLQEGQMQDDKRAEQSGGNMGQNPDGQGDSDVMLSISGGEIHIDAGGDGLDSNGNIYLSGGTVYIDGPVNDGNGIIDYELSFEMQGGTLIGAGSSGMLQTISDSSTQAGLAVVFDSEQGADTTVTVKDSDGKEIISYQPSKTFHAVVLSVEAFETGKTYEIYLDDTLYKEIELSSVSTIDGTTGMGGGGMKRPDGTGRENDRMEDEQSNSDGTI